FVIDGFTWDFGDGTTDTDNLVTTHSWDEPGQYLTELFLLDDNGCSSSNLVSLEVLVATPPSWSPFPGDTTLCLGESLVMDAFPDDYELTWTGAETNYENPDNIILEDELGVPNQSEINIAGFEPGQTLVNPNDLDIGVSMNHSFLFDLVISLTCPSGQNILLHQQMAQPDGDDVGSNGTDLGIPDGDFYDYVWTADAAETWSQVGTTGDNESLPAGEYLSLQSMDGLIGCDLNGTWTLEIIDNWGGDDGELAAWNMAFNPQIIPDAPEFTPDIGSYSDSSFWSLTPPDGLGNLSLSDDGNVISFDSVDEGVWDFTYVATNNHGCINDSTVTVTIEEALQANAGPDLIFCGNTVLEGGLADIPSPQCTNDAGNYTFCYENNVNATFTYCPDNPGDGVTFVDITFNSGSVEGGWDDLYVYDGESNAAPLLAGPIGGDLTGLQFVATNATGCITIEVNPDGSGDCAGGGQTPWDYDVGCSATQPPYVFEWSPVDGLSDPNVATPTLSDLDQETTYTLYTYPIGRPDCASTDEMTVFPAFEYNVSSEAAICPNYPSTIEAFVDPNSGNGPWTIDLYEDNSLVQTIESTGGSTVFDELYSNDYNVIITELQCSFIEDVPLDIPVGLDVISSPDTTICIGGTATIEAELSQAVDNLVFYWSNGESGVDNIDVTPTQESEVTVYAGFGDNCFTESDTITISFYDPLELSIIGDAELCFGDSSFVAVNTETGGLPPYSYSWAEDGSDVSQLASQWVTPDETKTWCLTLTDACETPSVQECVELIVDLEIPTTFTADTLGG
ncbi:MAG: PKD domain-containing protein, partial [Flavobacteriales bacterium]